MWNVASVLSPVVSSLRQSQAAQIHHTAAISKTYICLPHQCQHGEHVDAYGIHSLVCKRVSSRTARHHALNELVARAFVSAGIPVTKEPNPESLVPMNCDANEFFANLTQRISHISGDDR